MTDRQFTSEQQAEIDKYILAYAERDPGKRVDYKMGRRRYDAAKGNLQWARVFYNPASYPGHNSYLDVGCGRGEMLDCGLDCGFMHIMGTEVVPELLNPKVRFAPPGICHSSTINSTWSPCST